MTNNYMPIPNDELELLWTKHTKLIEQFVTDNHYNKKDIKVDRNVIAAIITKVDQRKQYFSYFHHLEMSDLKELALNCFWYVKLHPIVVNLDSIDDKKRWEYRSINEKFAVFFLIKELRALLRSTNGDESPLEKLSEKYVRELVYTLSYRDISKEAMIILVESMAILLGLDPYRR